MTWIAALLGLGAGLLLAEVLRRRHRLTGRHRGSPLWRVHCRDIDGTRAEIWVTVGRRHVVLRTPDGETLLFEPVQVGPLRAVLREAAIGQLNPESVGR